MRDVFCFSYAKTPYSLILSSMSEKQTYFPRAIPSPRARAPEQTHAEHRDRLMHDLDVGVSFVQRTWTALERLPRETTLEELDSWIASQREDLKRSIPFDAPSHKKALAAIDSQLAKPQKTASYEELVRRQELRQQREHIAHQPDALAHERFQCLTASLRTKYQQVRALEKAGPGAPIKALQAAQKEFTHKPLSKAAVKETIVGLFDVTFRIEDASLQTLGARDQSDDRRFGGLHFGETPFCCVSDKTVDPIKTMRHERLHNIFSGFVLSADGPTPEQTYTQFIEDQRTDLANPQDEHAAFYAELVPDSFTPTRFIDGLHDELLAALEQAEITAFGASGVYSESKRDKAAALHATMFQNGTYTMFRTAGIETDRLLALLRKPHPARVRFPKLAAFEDNLEQQISHGMERLQRGLAIGYDMVHGLQAQGIEEALDYFHAACFSLRPSEWSHLPALLGHHFKEVGGEKFQAECTTEYALEKSIVSFHVMLARVDSLDPSDPHRQATVAHLMRTQDFCAFVERQGISDLADARRIWRILTSPSQTYSEIERRGKIERFNFGFFSTVIDSVIRSGLQTIPPWFGQLTESERAVFLNCAEDSLDEPFPLFELWDSMKDPEKETPWETIRQLGLEDLFKRLLERYKKMES